jgi:hypothetical protein
LDAAKPLAIPESVPPTDAQQDELALVCPGFLSQLLSRNVRWSYQSLKHAGLCRLLKLISSVT